ncbi:6-hydroxymethylpterin diphosphokinase MptE-like protein, partial [uncultured Clostridium sp.]|uniref:6-hydroxymethylpterin diphosphokinase MptE-like protein n=1 Tax=uncultured Clostridium sp. TaxID=59620 RepID=UPI0025FCE107
EGYIEKTNIPLFFYEGTNCKVVKKHKGIKILSRYGHSYSKFVEDITQAPIIKGEGGGSVAHYMTLQAIYMGCNPIIFIGQDLAYDDEKKYSQLAQISSEIIDKTRKDDDIYVEGVSKKLVRSDIYLNSFRIEFEKIIKRFPDVKFINATEGGARIKGTLEMSLKDVVNRYGNNFEKNIEVEYSVNIKENMLKKLQKINGECFELFKLLKTIIEKIDIFKIENNEILKLECKIDKYISSLEILQTLFYPVFYEILNNKYGLFDDSNRDINYLLEEKKIIYVKIKDILEYALPQINKALKTININNERSE